MSIIAAMRQKQEAYKCKAILVYIVTPCLKKTKDWGCSSVIACFYKSVTCKKKKKKELNINLAHDPACAG
jgi:hypothetical protein